MKHFMGSTLAATALLIGAGTVQAGSHKIIGGLVDGAGGAGNIGSAIGRSLDDLNIGNALPPAGAVPNINGNAVPNINGGAIPNINGNVPNLNNAVPDAPNTVGIYAPAPPAPTPNLGNAAPNQGIYGGFPQNAQPNNPYTLAPAPAQTPYTLAPAPAGRNAGAYEDVGDLLDAPNPRAGDPIYGDLELRPLNAAEVDAQLPSPPRNIPGQPALTNNPIADAVGDVPQNSPGFYKRNKRAIKGAAAGLALGGLGVGGYYLGQDIAEGQKEGGESKAANAANDAAEWTSDAYDTVAEEVDSWF